MSAGPDLWTALATIMFAMLSWYRYESGRKPGDPPVDWRLLRTAMLPVALFTVTAHAMQQAVIR